jgi:hypothetical protein
MTFFVIYSLRRAPSTGLFSADLDM